MPIITSLKQHFSVRAIEWGMAGWALSWGLMLLMVPSIFTNPLTSHLFSGILETISWMNSDNPGVVFGFLFVLLGTVRGVSLLINGLWTKTPLIRIIASAVSAFFIMHIIVGLASGPPNTGTLTYSWLFLADCLSARRATDDWIEARRVKAIVEPRR